MKNRKEEIPVFVNKTEGGTLPNPKYSEIVKYSEFNLHGLRELFLHRFQD